MAYGRDQVTKSRRTFVCLHSWRRAVDWFRASNFWEAEEAWCRVQETLGSGDAGFRVQGSGLRVQGSGFRVQSSGFGVQGSGFRAHGSGLRVRFLGFGIERCGCRVKKAWFDKDISRPPTPLAHFTLPPFLATSICASRMLGFGGGISSVKVSGLRV